MTQTVGGRCDVTIDGTSYSFVADIEIDESNIEVDVVDNQDGTIGRSVKSSHYESDVKFRHMKGLDIQTLMGRTFDFSMVERDTGQKILMTSAFLKGKPKRNTVTGEISGLMIVSAQYRRI